VGRRDRHGRRPRPLTRRVAERPPKKTVVVFCEGMRTEPEYVSALKREPAIRDTAAVDIQVEMSDSGAVPETLVERAMDFRESFGEEVDEIWCIFDVEQPKNHPNLRQAVDKAKAANIRLAISNPCFEIWLVLHFTDHTAWVDNSTAQRLRRQSDGQTKKSLLPSQYMPRREEAARRASALEKAHYGNGTRFPDDNPSSGMHLFVRSVSTQGWVVSTRQSDTPA
jgi:hypothetical protein